MSHFTLNLHSYALNFIVNVYTSLTSKTVTPINMVEISWFRGLLDNLKLFKFDIKWIRERVDQNEEMMANVCPEVIGELDQLKRRIKVKDLDVAMMKEKLAEK
ncbi:hypothetical protein LguiB_004400 [Lonicera macranthoides]